MSQAKMLLLHLREMLSSLPVVVTSGVACILVRPTLADKGLRTDAFLREAVEKRWSVFRGRVLTVWQRRGGYALLFG